MLAVHIRPTKHVFEIPILLFNFRKTKNYPFLVQVTSIELMKAASSKSRYQSGEVHCSVIVVPFSGEAERLNKSG